MYSDVKGRQKERVCARTREGGRVIWSHVMWKKDRENVCERDRERGSEWFVVMWCEGQRERTCVRENEGGSESDLKSSNAKYDASYFTSLDFKSLSLPGVGCCDMTWCEAETERMCVRVRERQCVIWRDLIPRTAYCTWSVILSQSPISISLVSFQRKVVQET